MAGSSGLGPGHLSDKRSPVSLPGWPALPQLFAMILVLVVALLAAQHETPLSSRLRVASPTGRAEAETAKMACGATDSLARPCVAVRVHSI